MKINAGRSRRRKEKSIYTSAFFLFCSALFLLLSSAVSIHEYHVSVTQIQYNSSAKVFEVSIRIFTDDLQKALSDDNNKRSVLITDNDQTNPLIERYIRKHFVLTNQQKKAGIQFMGKEQEADATWIYLEIPFPDSPVSANLQGWKLQNSVLMEAFEDQVNMTNLKYTSASKTYLFKKGQPVQSL